jgi:prephenate dehydratase
MRQTPSTQSFDRFSDPLKVAIQGVRASFHDVAARTFFQNRTIAPLECSSFPALGQQLAHHGADAALMAIENSIAGSILPNYSLLEAHRFKIVGEVYLRIEMNLIALPGQKLSEIHSVQSHPMALLQCEDFLLAHPHMKVIEASDTAESAKEVSVKKLQGHAAIASRLAAETYGLQILAPTIQSNQQNVTRFLVVCRSEDYIPNPQANKCSLRFEAPDRPGSLVKILEVLDRNQVNMTKLQSVVIPGRPYEYAFHVDMEWENHASYEQAMKELSARADQVIHFGEYMRGERRTNG